jgi:hypothetical protein
VRETVERLCRDLGLNPDWSRWDGEGWIAGDPFARPLCSRFNRPGAKPLLDDRGETRPETPAPFQSLQDGHVLE